MYKTTLNVVVAAVVVFQCQILNTNRNGLLCVCLSVAGYAVALPGETRPVPMPRR